MNAVVFFFRELKLDSGAIWLEGETIKLSTSKRLQTAETRNFITENKDRIISILKENNIFSKERFLNVLIFKDSASTQFPLSPAQERLWFIEQYEQGSNAYHIPMIYELNADTDTEGMKHAIRQIVDRHEILRTTIEQADNAEHGIQVVHDRPLSFEEKTVTGADELQSLIEADINRPFDLSNEYPIRVSFYYLPSDIAAASERKTILLINTHHIASDGWSIEIFGKEMYAYYEAYINKNTSFALPPLEIQYKDYAVWQRTYLTGDALEQQAAYWKEKLAGYQTLELPADHVRPAEVDYRGAGQEFVINAETSQQLRTLAQEHGATLFSVMLSSINIFLGKYTGQDDIVIGSVIANRHHRQTENLIGFFVNTQVNRTLLNRTQSYEELIQQVHEEQVQAQINQDLPFEKLVEELGVERDASRHPVFQVMFDLQSSGSQEESADSLTDDEPDEEPEPPKEYLTPFESENSYGVEKFDLSVNIVDGHGEELIGQISYATALFNPETIEQFILRYTYLLEQLAASPQQPYSQLNILTPEEYDQVINDWNATGREHASPKTIYQSFQEQVEKTPGHIALVFEGQQLTYAQLNQKSNQLARHIREQYLQRTGNVLTPDTFIALYLDRSLEMVIAILAVLKAGGAYVPIDTSYPQERIDYILKDTKAALVLTQRLLQEELATRLPEDQLVFVNLSENFYQTAEATNLPQHSGPEDLAYLIYTSGSTGQAKGVQIEHAPVVNMAMDRVVQYKMTAGENSLQIASICFDASVEQIFVALFSGATLTMIRKEILFDGDQCEQFLNENNITHLDTVPSFLETLDFSKLTSLKRIASGGEACTVELVNRITPYIEFYNEYGPTEATVIATSYRIEKNTTVDKLIPIGKPISDTQLFILDKYLNIVPAGIAGEIYIGGNCLARGYLNSEQLTCEKFISNPFGAGRLYKTGDLGRWMKDGQVEYIGRNDDQVKIRGFRIELGEIDQALSRIAGIRQSCVLVKERKTGSVNTKFLVAYYVPDKATAAITKTDIREQLSLQLPEYMVPSAFMELDDFPVTLSGKLDKNALPRPDFSDNDQFTSPETELEKKLCQVYADVLGLASDQISTHESFFNMGGSSILSIRLKGKLKQLEEFKSISIADLFKYNTISKLIHSLQKRDQPEFSIRENKVQHHNHEIAIIGVSGAFSGAANVDELWALIAGQQEGPQFFNRDDCEELGLDKSIFDDPNFIPVINTIQGIDLFEPSFWEMSPNEARQLDPQIRKFMEHCWLALDTAGYAQQRRDEHIGVFAGSGSGSYFYDNVMNGEMAGQINMWEASASNGKDALATKVAYHLDLSGPANSINTACSTGLVCIVEACKNLQLGTCDMALAGGVSLSMPDDKGYYYEEGMILSRDGHCRVFDSEATGTIAGSGVGVVLLKRLDDAITDNDPILGVIKGYATNNDGSRKTGYTAPSLIGQAECILAAQKMAGISADQVQYVECHGTGTNLGDPIEVQALKEAFQNNLSPQHTATHKTVLGAIKANIGHTDSAAGTAGLIKVVAMLQHDTIPGQVNYEQTNPELQLDQTRFEIIKENRHWPANANQPRLAGVSSFGIGGTNAHVVLGDYTGDSSNNNEIPGPVSPEADEQQIPQYIVPVSAKSRQSLENYKQALTACLTDHAGNKIFHIRDIAYTLQERREHFNFRTAYKVKDTDELLYKMSGEPSFTQTSDGENKIVLMFPGQGAQYINMAKALYDNEPFFKNSVDQCIGLANQHLPVDLFKVLYPRDTNAAYGINEIEWTPVSLFTIEYSLAKFLEQVGIRADAYIGHSFGEYVAATMAGVFSVADAIKILIARGRLMQAMPVGSMLSINASEAALKKIVKDHNCDIAVINSIEDVVVSGTAAAVAKLQLALEKLDIPVVKINAAVAGHSRLMEEAAKKFEQAFEGIQLNKPKKSFVSNLSGEIAGDEVTKPAYWCQQLRHTVQFAKGIDSLSRRYNHQVSFIETGTGKGLGYFVNKYRKANNYQSVQAVQLLPSAKEIKAAESNASQQTGSKEDIKAILWMAGIIKEPNDTRLFNTAKRLTNLPAYQFNFQKCWIEKSETIRMADDGLNLLPETQWLNTPVWSAVANLAHSSADNMVFANALIFIREDQRNLIDFAALTQSHQLVVFDTTAGAIDTSDPALIRLDPTNEKHIEKLATYIRTGQFSFDTIIHAASINADPSVQQALDHGFYSLFLLREYLLKTFDIQNLVVLTNGLAQITNDDRVHSINGTLVGAVRNINHEYRQLDARIIDIGYEKKNLSACISQVWAGEAYHKSEELIALRFGKIWIEGFEKIKQALPEEEVIEDGDIILVTGGLGGVGLAITSAIASKHNVQFVLVSRKNIYDDSETDANKEKIGILESVKAGGSSVIIHCADISDPTAVSSMLDKIKKQYGAIAGIVHTAGASPLEIDEHNLANIKDALKGKVYGIHNIVNALDTTGLKFIASTSSLASIMGDVNRIEYCASNSYLDYLAVDKQRFGATRIVSVNWNGWLSEGMTKENVFGQEESTDASKDLYDIMMLNGDSFEHNADLFYRLIGQGNYSQVIVSKFDIATLKENLFRQEETELPDREIAILEENYTETEYQVALIFGDVLGVEQVSLHDDFFKLGGNSILAIQVSHRMSKALGYDVKVADLFKHSSISQLLLHKSDQGQTAIPRMEVTRSVLSFAQERLWFIEQYEQGSNAYHIPSIYELDAGTDIEGMKYALQQIVARHEVLRTTIEMGDDEEQGIQIVHDEPLSFDEISLSSEEGLTDRMEEDINRPFHLRTEYPIRATFYTIDPDDDKPGKTILLVNTHHIASDGWSLEIFERELYTYYEAYVRNDTDFALPPLEIQYKDYAVWQRAYLTGEIIEKQLSYWSSKLTGYQTLELPVDFARPGELDYKGASVPFTLSATTNEKLRSLAQQQGVSLYSLLLTSLNILLGKYTGQDDIVVGSVIANRQYRQTESLIGFFVNTQVNRTLLNPTQSFEELIRDVHREQVEAQINQDLPFEKLVEELGVERDPSRHPIFQVMFALQTSGNKDQQEPGSGEEEEESTDEHETDLVEEHKEYITPYQAGDVYEVAKFDLSVTFMDNQAELSGLFGYATALFRKETIERLVQHYTNLLDQLAELPGEPYSRFSLLSRYEYNKVIYDWNAADTSYPQDKTIHQVFGEWAAKIPGEIAVVFEEQELSYRLIDEKSNQLARHIRTQYQQRTNNALAPDTFIALYLDRGPEMLIGILAVLKAGGAYVPIDTRYPQERIDYILEDSGAALVLSQQYLNADERVQLPRHKLCFIDLAEELYKTEDNSPLPPFATPSDLAYVIYTSGTTGRPKGVMVEHRHVLSFALDNNYIDYAKSMAVAGVSNYAFDGSVFDIFFTLLNGRRLILISNNTVSDLSGLDEELTRFKADTIFITTALFNSLVQNQATCFSTLQQVLFGGEACNIEMINQFKNRYPNTTLIHVYGPTENIVYSSYCTLSNYDTKNGAPIGSHLADKKLYVLDRNLSPVQIGVAGELYIGGAGVARGYLNRHDLTEERFVPDPFATTGKKKQQARMYKTGDQVRWLPDGNLLFIGRNDDQVKIRGFRIELGEIESVLSGVKGIRQCCVVVKERETGSGNYNYLAAYYVLDNTATGPTQAVILEQLAKSLPEYMVPGACMRLDALPVTINGKLDKTALPDFNFSVAAGEYIAPATENEVLACTIWKNTLGIDRVGITDDFFRIGGNSILAIQASHRMSKALGADIRVSDIFKYKSIQTLLQNIFAVQVDPENVEWDMLMVNGTKNGASHPATVSRTRTEIPKKDVLGRSVLSFAQERLWFIEQYEQGSNAYHVPSIYELDADTDIAGIKYALQQIVTRHEVLRTTIELAEDEVQGVQLIHDEPLAFEEVTLIHEEELESLMEEDINRPFDLSAEYPIRITLYTIEPGVADTGTTAGKTVLLINMHHIASDGWSLDIFETELFAYYEAYLDNDKDFALPPLPIQYKDYAVWQRSYLAGDILENQLSYWRNKLAGYQPLELPLDYPRQSEVDYSGDSLNFSIEKETGKKLRELARQNGVTIRSVMLSSINILLGKYTGQDDIVLGSVIANRHHLQTESLIGFFVNTQVNRTQLSNTQSFEKLIRQVHHEQVEAQVNQDLPFEKLVEDLGVERDPSRHPVFQVMFDMENSESVLFDPGNNTPQEETAEESKPALLPYQTEHVYEVEKFDFSINIINGQEDLSGYISYATALFHKDSIARLVRHYTHLLDRLAESPQLPYSQLSLLGQQEYDQVVHEWNATAADYPADKTIHELLQEQAAQTPDAIALVYEGAELSYKQLNEKSNQLARHIRKEYANLTGKALAPGTMIALYLDKSIEMVVGMMAIVKAGAAYIPLDINYPQERIAYLLNDTGAPLILSQQHLKEDHQAKLQESTIICIGLEENYYEQEDISNLPLCSSETDPAYVIYTSGTTGLPKGVKINHRSLVNLITEQKRMLGITAASKMLQYASLIFDASVWEIFSTLAAGAQLVIVPLKTRQDAHLLGDFLAHTEITIALLPPGLLNIMPYAPLPALKTLLVGGDMSSPETMHKWSRGRRLINAYGPTECTVITTMHPYEEGDKHTNIGKPVANSSVYVLDKNAAPVPAGITGELYIGGAGVAMGYLNKEELTAERFIPNRFATATDRQLGYDRLYRTGDLVRWMPDGNLEYIGRNDGQVKIRGFRIELGEIEHALSKIAGITQCCVVAKERKTGSGHTRYLVAYYVVDVAATALTHTSIAQQLSRILPDYMLPGAYMELAALPFTINGKIDKNALPDPDLRSLADEYIAPVTETERLLCNAWKKVLGLEQVGITDDFFRIGGNSILAIQASHRMSKILGCDVQVADVFKFKNIKMLLENIAVRQVDPDNVEWDVLVQPYHDHIAQHKSPEDMIFIHPGHGGSEVYQSLADMLSPVYNCIGIDNYNIHHKEKISSLQELAHYYLSVYKEKYSLNKSVNLLGWSLGGHIALEMAAILEGKGYKNINVFLLDTLVSGETIAGGARPKRNRHLHLKEGIKTKHKGTYFKKVAAAFETEIMLANSAISSYLHHTRVVLFKATQPEKDTHSRQGHGKKPKRHSQKLKANNIDRVAGNLSVIDLNCDHENILKTNSTTVGNYILAKKE